MENNIHPKLEEDQINQSNVQEEPNVLDVQTLENLAAFLSRDSNNPQPNINNQETNVNNQVQYRSEYFLLLTLSLVIGLKKENKWITKLQL